MTSTPSHNPAPASPSRPLSAQIARRAPALPGFGTAHAPRSLRVEPRCSQACAGQIKVSVARHLKGRLVHVLVAHTAVRFRAAGARLVRAPLTPFGHRLLGARLRTWTKRHGHLRVTATFVTRSYFDSWPLYLRA